MSIRVRAAVAADAEGVTSVHLRAWREAYTGLVPEAVLAAREANRADRVARWEQILGGHSPHGDERAFVAEQDGRIVGWATASDGRDDDAPYPNELDGLYILAEVYGTGAGRLLLEAAVGVGTGAYLWVLDGNGRAT
ncbi:MAG: GNAT family N-acetyltransferase, partial [Protaetiibacter sp.]